jgi:hypothetical protein
MGVAVEISGIEDVGATMLATGFDSFVEAIVVFS